MNSAPNVSMPMLTGGSALAQTLQRLPRWLTLVLPPLLSLTIGWLDFITGWEWSLFVLYAVPISMAVWWDGRTAGLILAVLSAAIWWVANQAENPYQTALGYNMAMVSRLFYFVLAAVGGAAIRNKQASDAAHIEMLEARRRLELDIVAISEHEQQRIGQDLHDGLCQQLAAIGCAARALADDLKDQNLPEAADAMNIETAMQQAVLEARNLARGIFPVHVDRGGLVAALSDLAITTARLTGADIELFEDSDVHIDDPDVAMHLYRIAQEALANATRHSHASKIVIRLRVIGDRFELSITDNGCGMPPDQMGTEEGMGLRTMRYRAEALGAALAFEPHDEHGTTVRCSLRVRTTTIHTHG